ncbi:gamma-aminobutyric acid receptor-associated 2 [Stylonychia lemnae]|uniref:Autophagy-related protein n=1 Tax=Stylonychia lemnae TaxID=5949 RepID=A0A078B3M4_STYLE|nr:gamma-aminobutyric acid receptor-associated 2 [Stylonychia lemnae]|eukprot:CDW88108.1 gamma-aminobutyric acid receptor-associated 2 [Stylonychia lemnae]
MSKTRDDFNFQFKDEIAFERRAIESEKIRLKYDGRIPVIIEKSSTDQVLCDLEQTKFLIPGDFTFQQFQMVIRKRLQLPKTHSLYIFFHNNKLHANEKSLSQIYSECKDHDGFLYCKYASENFTG